MAYITESDMVGVVPDDIRVVALDDDNSGMESENVWDIIVTAVERRINGILGSRYATPFSEPLPDVVKDAAITFAANLLFLRRGIPRENNPWAKEAESMTKRLESIAKGAMDLTADPSVSADGDGAIISEPSRTHSANSDLMV